MNRTALVSAGVGDEFSGVVAGAWLGGMDALPEEFGSALVAGPSGWLVRVGALPEELASALVAGPGVLVIWLGTLPEEVASTLVAGPGVGIMMLTVVQWILANSRRHLREKCFARGLRTRQTGTLFMLTPT